MYKWTHMNTFHLQSPPNLFILATLTNYFSITDLFTSILIQHQDHIHHKNNLIPYHFFQEISDTSTLFLSTTIFSFAFICFFMLSQECINLQLQQQNQCTNVWLSWLLTIMKVGMKESQMLESTNCLYVKKKQYKWFSSYWKHGITVKLNALHYIPYTILSLLQHER